MRYHNTLRTLMIGKTIPMARMIQCIKLAKEAAEGY
jgi:hypothetical protein